MLRNGTFRIIAGQDVVDEINFHKEATVKRSWGDTYDSESLCAHQREMSRRGYLGAELVQSNYGTSVRYDSGLQNFGLIARARELGGTFEAAVEFARKWQAVDPVRRYVWTREAAAGLHHDRQRERIAEPAAMTDIRSNQLPASTIASLAKGLIRRAGCEVFYVADHAFIDERAGKGWCAAEIARLFIRANFAKGDPLRRKFLTALTKLGAHV